MFEIVKRKCNWRRLCERYYNIIPGAIEPEHSSDETKLKAVVKSFLLGGDCQPTWRRVIHQLHVADEIPAARYIITYAEAVEGE